jgi:hypothetical protein
MFGRTTRWSTARPPRIAGALGLILTGGMIGASLAWAVPGSAAPNISGPRVIMTVEVNKQSTFIDVGDPGSSIGDMLIIRSDLVDPKSQKPLGFAQATCNEIVVEPLSLECFGTMHLAHGVVTVAGSFFVATKVNTWGVTGGTGVFQNARGYMSLSLAHDDDFYHKLYLIP